MTDQLRHNANLIESLGSALRSGQHGLGTVPALLKQVLKQEGWREFVTQRGEDVKHERFAEFVATPPLRGLGATTDLLRNICRDDPEALDLLDRALTGQQGERTDLVNNVNEVRPQGNRAETALRRLRKDRPDLHERVLSGDLSPHRAMVEAGFRHRTQSIRVDDPDSAARALRRHMPADARARLIELLREDE